MYGFNALRLISCAILIAFSSQSIAQNKAPEVTIEAIPVADGIYMLTGSGGNLGLSVGDEVVLVFTQDYSQNESAVESTIINSYNKYLIFDISGSDLPQVGGLYTVNLAIEPVWNTYDVFWEEAKKL